MTAPAAILSAVIVPDLIDPPLITVAVPLLAFDLKVVRAVMLNSLDNKVATLSVKVKSVDPFPDLTNQSILSAFCETVEICPVCELTVLEISPILTSKFE